MRATFSTVYGLCAIHVYVPGLLPIRFRNGEIDALLESLAPRVRGRGPHLVIDAADQEH